MWTPKKLNKQAEECLHDLFRFLIEYWGLDLKEKPHREMCAVIQNAEEDETRPYTMLTVPRSTYKTSIARGALVWKQLRQIYLHNNPYHRILLASATLALGETSLRVIEGQLKHNKKLAADYGKLWLNDRKAGLVSRDPEGIILAPRLLAGELASVAEPSFWVASVRRISTGFHADEAFVDDLNNKENTATDTQRKKVQDYWDLLFPILEPKDRGGKPTRLTFTNTPWHDGDVRGTILKREEERMLADPTYETRWNTIHHSAYNEDGSAYFPDKLSLTVLEEYRENMAVDLFSANYLCDPVGENGFVTEDQIIWKSRDLFPELHHIRCTVDPNQHKEAKAMGCYAALAISGYDRFSNLYFLDIRGSRKWSVTEFIDELFAVQDEYPDAPILIEDENMSYLEHSLKLEEAHRTSAEKRVHLRVHWVPAARNLSKYEKWQKVQPRFRSGRVIFAEEIEPKIKAEVREELVRGQAARFKDFLDVIAMAETGIRPKVQKDGTLQDQTAKVEGKYPTDPNARTWAHLAPDLAKLMMPR